MEAILDTPSTDVTGEATEPEEPDYGPNFTELPEDKVAELRSIIETCAGKRDLWGRMVEIIRCTLRRYFWIGIQHGFWNADTQQFQVGPNGGSIDNLNEEDLFQGDFNIYTQNGKIFIAVFSQSAAPTRIEPDKPGDPASAKAAAEAEKYVEVYEKYNPPQVAQQEVGRLFWTDGRVIAVTKSEPSEDSVGVDEDEEGNEVPRETELTKYYGVLETKCPLVEPFQKWPYLIVSQEIDVLTAKDENPEFADKIQESSKGLTPNGEIARMSRIAVAENIAQISSDTLAHMVTEDTVWLRRSAFRDLDKAKQAFWIGGQTKNEDGTVTQTKGIFPQGCRTKWFGSVYCGAEAVAMNKEVRVCHAMPGNGNSRPSLSDALIPIQMEFNDAVGMYSEMLHKCIPRIHIDAGPEELQAILEQFSRYGEYSGFENPSPGQPLENSFFPEPTVSMPGGFSEWLENLQGPLSQFVTGNSTALFGDSDKDQTTAKGYAQMRDASLGLMSIVWVPYLAFAGQIRAQAALCARKRDGESIKATVSSDKGDDQTVSIDLRILRGGGFLSAPVTDQNFPESWTETSNTWKMLKGAAATDPVLAQSMNLPDNLVAFKNAIGLKDFVIQGADSRDLQLQEWAQMQQDSGPIPDEQATQQRDQQKQQMATQAAAALGHQGQLPPLPEEKPIMRSSVQIDVDTDDHVVHALEMFRILNSPDGQKIKSQKPLVWDDGKLHMLAHVQAAKMKGLIIPPPLGGPPPMAPPPGHVPPKPGAGAPPPA
jgi:hypothetical protein